MRETSYRTRAFEALTFWLRPAFVLRALHRFQRLAGFDRAVGLAASALVALIPLTIVVGSLLSRVDGRDAAQRLIDRYDLSGGGAEAVRDALSPATGSTVDVGLFGLVLLIFAVLAFSRASQRLVEQTWELSPLSVRNSLNGLIWIAGLGAYAVIAGWIRALVGGGPAELIATIAVAPLTFVFLVWSGWILSGRRLPAERLLPFGLVGAVLFAGYSIAADVYVPHLFSSYATRYGVIGAAFAMIAALFGAMVCVVAAAAVGREFGDELARVRRGERPPEHEVRREWDAVVSEARSRWSGLREQVAANRRRFSDRRR